MRNLTKLGSVMSLILLCSFMLGLTEARSMKELKSIAEEKNGYKFGEVWRLEEGSLVAIMPIVRKDKSERDYILVCESDKAIITDTGQINKMTAENLSKKPLLIRGGEIFTGKTQTRAAQRSVIVMPNEKVTFDVVCIYASKGIQYGAIVDSDGGTIPADMNVNFLSSTYHSGNVDQHKTWNDVKGYSSSLSADVQMPYYESTRDNIQYASGSISTDVSSNYDNLEGVMEGMADNLKEILTKVPKIKNQAGVVLLDTGGVKMINCFDLSKSWEVIREESVKQYGEKLTAKKDDGTFTFNPDKAKEQAQKVLMSTFEEKIYEESGDKKIIGISSGNYVGEVTILKGKVIHLNISRK